ncbi:MAG TPA: UDP-glucose/GDP-mannose dehydrogenase family protein [Chloroflexus aurantiacus]|uniref:UDP-glucose 6-dehydrogenase n=1 Tax=Chloroflexus aurantiacus (strain ATCC 29366 / DSM 635 / J-10-fl) TaxID=324602 RepID=A9WF67_CHLAA|nr:UDP-glucose/GDP-mannose dehydrogenase family protein [Chloroflexus aurantiacus]ABY36051.1 nucleotide sugar dehydrogenase [Chloroflexus aurantiacus J-10-fl]RMG49340.1 MAG: UDP-glucose/GDP-mannose dehydrogenase family protein [Chloroflexota bacterium]GIV91420.1 MAG: UDP-glucose 6-dehydrogenase [Chloroflexus sp.]HBW67301.1 UDP-glucose/GDP-mannose dehydrogenase family protein [Chloroflexus aurantiacus]
MKNICVVGTGYVGLTTGVCFADLGHSVTCIEIDLHKLELLRSGKSPIFEPGLEELQERNMRAGRLRFTDDYAVGIPDAEFIFITVGTPMGEDGSADLTYVKAAARSIGQYLRSGSIIIDKSTVPVGTGDMVENIIAEYAGPDVKFDVVSNPEFLREGSALSDFFKPDRIVLGAKNREAAQRVAALHETLGAPIIITDLRTAEMIKYASNAFLATRISFINEIAQICERLGADVREVARGMGADKRIGPHFLEAGVGYGGSCFPKDVLALYHMAASAGCHPQLLQAVMDINSDARKRFVKKVETVLGDLEGRVIGVLGLSFKPNTDDMREAPSVDIINSLLKKGARVKAYDPVAMARAEELLPTVTFTATAYDVAKDADALLLVTEWNEFKQLDWQRIKRYMRQPVVIDGRNLYDPREMRNLGFIYWGVGRGEAPVPIMEEAQNIGD